jgi:hypothetical protein
LLLEREKILKASSLVYIIIISFEWHFSDLQGVNFMQESEERIGKRFEKS